MPDVVVLFFVLGVIARVVKSDLALPPAFLEAVSIYLLLSIGVRGGVELAHAASVSLVPEILACLAIGFATPFLLAPALRLFGLNSVDSGAVAGHYGSVSVVTFAVGIAYFAAQGEKVDSHSALWVALMESPGIVAGIFLARMGAGGGLGSLRVIGHEVFFGKSVLLLVGGLAIGAAAGKAGVTAIEPVFYVAFKGVLAFYLLELGLVAGGRLGAWRANWKLVPFAIIAPLVMGALGAALGTWLGLTVGSAATLATLAASASYIAAPTAMRASLPDADSSLSIGLVLGVTFPFNVLVGIPIYLAFARTFAHLG